MQALFVKDLKRSSILAVLFVGMTFVFTQIIPSDADFYTSTYAVLSVIRLNAMMIIMVVYGAMMHVEKYEQKYKAYEMMKLLPLTQRELVSAKFAVYAVWCVFASAYSVVVVPLLFPAITDHILLRSQLVLMAALSLGATGVVYAGIVRFGYRKMKVWIMFVYIVMLMGPSIWSFVRQVTNGEEAMQRVAEQNMHLPVGGIALISIAVFVGAWMVASKGGGERV